MEKFMISIDWLFQFHYGTIKRLNAKIDSLYGVIFQFHYGTIKSQIANQ